MTASNQPFLKLGLIGHPVSHSLSPLMHRAAIDFCKREGTYDLVDVPPAQLHAAMLQLRQNFTGFNVTVPHKQTIVPLLDALTPEARLVRAVNTVRIEPDGRATGHNTDAGGFLQALQSTAIAGGTSPKMPCVCIIGAGGAARAALWAVARAGAEQVIIYARTQREARMMRDDFLKTSGVHLQVILRSPGEPLNTNAPALIVNCTPIGLQGDAPPEWIMAIMKNSRRGRHIPIFFDMVYSKTGEPTPLVKAAVDTGLLGCDGLQMLIEQAALAFEFWTGIKVPTSVMASAVSQAQTTRR